MCGKLWSMVHMSGQWALHYNQIRNNILLKSKRCLHSLQTVVCLVSINSPEVDERLTPTIDFCKDEKNNKGSFGLAGESNPNTQSWRKKCGMVWPWRMFLCSSSSAVGLWLSRLRTQTAVDYFFFKGWCGSFQTYLRKRELLRDKQKGADCVCL